MLSQQLTFGHRGFLHHFEQRVRRQPCVTGASILESSLILTLFFLALFGAFEFGVLLFDRAVIINASREGARVGARFDVDPSSNYAYAPATDAEITQRVQDYASGHLISFVGSSGTSPSVSVSPSWTNRQDGGSGSRVNVTVTYDFQFLLLPNFLSHLAGGETLTAVATMRME